VLLRSSGCLLIPLLRISDTRAAGCIPLAIGKRRYAVEFGSSTSPNLDDRAAGAARKMCMCGPCRRGGCEPLPQRRCGARLRQATPRDRSRRRWLSLSLGPWHGGGGRGFSQTHATPQHRCRGDKAHRDRPHPTADAPHAVHRIVCDRSDHSGVRRAWGVMPVAETSETPIAFATKCGASWRQAQG
jgi:hypothetical protein